MDVLTYSIQKQDIFEAINQFMSIENVITLNSTFTNNIS